MAPRVASSRLIGRSAELAELEAALADAVEWRPSLALVAGESGVGKTRLLAEFQQRAQEAGALVLAGEAVDLGGESELPYQPLVAALRPLARAGDPALTAPLREAVAPLLPGAPARPSAADDSQARLFEGLLSLLEALGQPRPVLLVIEDLQWADRSTRSALAFLSRSLTDERVLLVASYRPDELQRGHPLRPLRTELERHPRTRRIALEPLTRAELADLLADILGSPPAPELLEQLWERSGGNPLFGEELLAAGVDRPVPETLRDALMLRVERLSGTAHELLGLVAVGERLDHPLLEHTSGLESRALRDALREAVDGHILVATADSYRFRHALLREIVDGDLLPGERSELHLRLARALEERLDEDAGAQITAAVAHHFASAGDRPAAVTAAVRAAAAAERVHAHGEAAALYDRALGLWDRVPDAAQATGIDRVTVLVRAGEAAAAEGDPGRQLERLEAALADLGPRPDPRRAAHVMESMARAQRHLNHASAGIATLEQALALFREAGDDDVRAGVLAALGRALMLVGRYDEAARVAREALAVATQAPALEGHARNTLGYSIAMAGDVDEGAAELQEAIRIAREHGSLTDLATACINFADMLHSFGRTDRAREIAAEGRKAVEGRHSIAVVWFDLKLAELAFDAGDWEQAEASLPDPRRTTATQTHLGITLRRAALALGRGDQDAAAALLDELEPMGADSGEPTALAPLAVLAAERRRREGEIAAARAAVDQGLDKVARHSDHAAHAATVAAAGVAVEADAAERARDLGDSETESAALRRVDELLARVSAAATPARQVERALLLGARAEAGRAAGEPDPSAYSQAAAAWDALARPEPAARMRWREAEAHLGAGDREAAAEAARTAHATAARLGAGWLRGEIEDLATRGRLPLEPLAEAPEPPEEDAFGLTAREREVLALLAEGATNREIGGKLYMAEKTASVHVSRILSKLNARTRTEAAAVARRHGLA